MNVLRASLFVSLSILAVLGSFIAIWQTYEYKIAFSLVDDLKIKNNELSFQSNILIEEVQYSRNQLTLRRVAQNNLGMRAPKLSEKVIIRVPGYE
jgi:cell division protein FtsL